MTTKPKKAHIGATSSGQTPVLNGGNLGAQQNRRDLESPYRRFVVTTELRSDPKQSKDARWCIRVVVLPVFGDL
jgi:hypothetical protein